MAANKQDKEISAENITDNHCEIGTIYIQIGKKGEVNAWGLDQDSEEVILERTGNRKLARLQQNMAYTLCG